MEVGGGKKEAEKDSKLGYRVHPQPAPETPVSIGTSPECQRQSTMTDRIGSGPTWQPKAKPEEPVTPVQVTARFRKFAACWAPRAEEGGNKMSGPDGGGGAMAYAGKGGEVLTVQVGSFANLVGAHFWNIQTEQFVFDQPTEHDDAFEADGKDKASAEGSGGGPAIDLAHDCLFRAGLSPTDGRVTYLPRAVVVDLNGVQPQVRASQPYLEEWFKCPTNHEVKTPPHVLSCCSPCFIPSNGETRDQFVLNLCPALLTRALRVATGRRGV